jgi:hypothetical protein
MLATYTPDPHLPLLEEALALEVKKYQSSGLSETEWLEAYRRLAVMPPATGQIGAKAENRLDQVILNLKTAGLWPW